MVKTSCPGRTRVESPISGRWQIGGVDLDQRQILLGIARHDLTFEATAIAEDDLQRIAPARDVVVGDDQTVFTPDRAGAVAIAPVDLDDRWTDLFVKRVELRIDGGMAAQEWFDDCGHWRFLISRFVVSEPQPETNDGRSPKSTPAPGPC